MSTLAERMKAKAAMIMKEKSTPVEVPKTAYEVPIGAEVKQPVRSAQPRLPSIPQSAYTIDPNESSKRTQPKELKQRAPRGLKLGIKLKSKADDRKYQMSVDKEAVKRTAAGKMWEDSTLAEWPENDFRLFIGNLGVDVSDKTLGEAFSGYASFAKAKVIRDRISRKTKEYGFVSLLDSGDYLRALKEMDGRLLGNSGRPIQVKKSEWRDRLAAGHRKESRQLAGVRRQVGARGGELFSAGGIKKR